VSGVAAERAAAGAAERPRPKLPAYETHQGRAEIAYWELGEGAPLLLMHTFPDHSIGMLPLARELAAAGFRVILPTLPGFWPSGKVDGGDYSVAALAADLLGLLDGLGVERFDVVGHGWGGEIAYHLAGSASSSGRVRRAVVLSVPHAAGFARRHLSFEGMQSAGYAYFLAYSRHATAAASQPEWLTAAIAWGSPGMHREDWPAVLDLIARPREIEVAGAYYRCSFESDAAPAPVLVPTAVIHGTDTPAVPPVLYEGLEDWFPAGIARHLLPATGQWPHLEAPAVVLALIVDHLRDGDA
jgi:pimeloyl-ACP methyl ester carboxylesterase